MKIMTNQSLQLANYSNRELKLQEMNVITNCRKVAVPLRFKIRLCWWLMNIYLWMLLIKVSFKDALLHL